MSKTTTQSGVADNAALSFTEEDAADAFLSKWSEEDPRLEASEDPEDEDLSTEEDETTDDSEAEEGQDDEEESEGDPQEDSEESTEEGDGETDEDEDAATGTDVSDEAKVKIKVDDEEIEVSVKDLKRLYGQEAALTKKSQDVAAKRKELEASNQKAAAQLDRIYQKVASRWEPFSKVDMLVASKQLDADQFAALRKEAQEAYDDFRFITQEVDTFVQEQNTARQQAVQAQAKETVKVLKDAIPNWSQAIYNDIRSYAIEKGMDENVVNNLVDPSAILMVHKAMQFDKAKTIVTKKKVSQPKKVLKTTKPVTAQGTKVDKTAKAKAQLARSGTTDDAANLFMARWENS